MSNEFNVAESPSSRITIIKKNKMRPSRSRRVQAQRKFAQGAYIPANVTPAAPTNTERRENTRNTRNVYQHNGNATSLLNYVSCQSFVPEEHTNYEPYVRLEKLAEPVPTRVILNGRDEAPKSNKEKQKSVHNKNVAKPLTITKKIKALQRVHVMSLRSKKKSNLDLKIIGKSRRVTTRLSAAKRKVPSPVKSLNVKNKIKKSLKKSRLISTEFSLDDNRPLAYFLKSSTPKRPVYPLIALTPLKTPMEPVAGPSGLQKISNPNVILPSLSTTQTPSTSTSSSPLLPRRKIKPTTAKVPTQTGTDEPEKTSSTFYTEPNIYRWMTGSLSPDAGRQMEIENPDPLTIININATVCPASAWNTVKELINASQTQLDSRCTKCENCLRIDNIMKLSKVIMANVKVDMTGDEVTSTTTHTTASASSHNDCMYIELVPRHLDSLMKLQHHEILGKRLLSACLIPRSHAPALTDYTLIEQENILEKLNHTLRLIGAPKFYRRLTIDSIMSNESDIIALHPDKIARIRHNILKRRAKCRKLTAAKERLIAITALKARLKTDKDAELRKGTNIATDNRNVVKQQQIIEMEKGDGVADKEFTAVDKVIDHAVNAEVEVVKVCDDEVNAADEEEYCIQPNTNVDPRQVSPQEEEEENGENETSSDPGEGEYLQDESAIGGNSQDLRLRYEDLETIKETIVPVTFFYGSGPTTEDCMDEVDAQARALKLEKDVKGDDDSYSAGPSTSNRYPAVSGFPTTAESAKIVDAPVYLPSWEEFEDPIVYIEKIWHRANKFGICKVIPPTGWEPPCKINEDLRFDVSNQYISRFLNRWGPASRELSAIRLCLHQQNVNVTRPPQVDGVEINLPRLYHIVQRYGGLENVINRKRWGKVAEEMHFTKTPVIERKLDQIYAKYLLPYATLAHQERQEILSKVETVWLKKNNTLLERALNPFYRQKRMLGELESSEGESEDEATGNALIEAEDCVVKGQAMNFAKFKKVATNVYDSHVGGRHASIDTVEAKYWQHVMFGTDHLCVNTAAIDTGDEGHGFPKYDDTVYGKSLWNLKLFNTNPHNYLRYLGPVLGVTVPTLHLSMLYSTSCWHKDPHVLCWNEYIHDGAKKIWYGIPDDQSDNFRKAVETLTPTSCQNKSLWLSTDIAMIPPEVLREHNVSLSRTVQYPGEFVFVFPKAYSCSISTGYSESESVYFAPKSWLDNISQVIQETRESCEPTMFSLEQLLIEMSKDPKIELSDLKKIQPTLNKIIAEELRNRAKLKQHGLKFTYASESTSRKIRYTRTWNARDQECDFCRAYLYLSKVQGLTRKKSFLCLEHALKLLSSKRYENAVPEVFVYISNRELNDVAEKMKARLISV